MVCFLSKNCTPSPSPEKSHPPLSQQPPSKAWGSTPPPPPIPCAHYGRLFHKSINGLCKVFLWSSCLKKLPIKRRTRNIKARGFCVWAIYFYTFIVTKYWLENSIFPWKTTFLRANMVWYTENSNVILICWSDWK